MVHSFLLIGQSNMAGRGHKEEVEPIASDKIKVLRNGRWMPMYVPVNCDRPYSGICLAESFAEAYVKDHNAEVGLIPCADGGSSLEEWEVGGLLYEHAVFQAKLAQRTSTIAGVLWHQGESDCATDKYPVYQKGFEQIMSALRKELELYDVPFLVGGLGDFLKDCKVNPALGNYRHVNEALKQIAKDNAMTGFVSAEGLECNSDNLHFNSKSLREFGIRYYQEFLKLENKEKNFAERIVDTSKGNELVYL